MESGATACRYLSKPSCSPPCAEPLVHIDRMSRSRRNYPVDRADLDAVMRAAAADQSARGSRDAAILALLFDAGLGSSNVTALNLSDVDCADSIVRRREPEGAHHPSHVTRQVKEALSCWIRSRGLDSGPLFHPILRPDRIAKRRITASIITSLVARRAMEARVRPFSPDDIVRSRAFGLCGQWKANCCGPMQSTDPISASDHPVSRELVIRYLACLGPTARRNAHEALTALAIALGGTDALTFCWSKVRPEDFKPSKPAKRLVPHRLRTNAKKGLFAIVEQAHALGLMPQAAYDSICQVRWDRNAAPVEKRTLSWGDMMALFVACLSGPSSAHRRDGGLFALIWSERIGASGAVSYPNLSAAMRNSDSLPAVVTEAMSRWGSARGASPGPLLLSLTRTGQINDRPMTVNSVAFAFRRRSQEAGIGNVTIDDLRRLAMKHYGEIDF